MGNEASSVRIHHALTADDIKGLRSKFPGGGNGPPPTDLAFGEWARCWPEEERGQLKKILSKDGSFVTFHAYQELAGASVRGTTEDRVKLIFRLLDRPVDKTIKSGELLTLIRDFVSTVSNLFESSSKQENPSETSMIMAKSLMHELVFPNESAKTVASKEIPEDIYLDFDMIERWLVMKCPLFEEIYLCALARSFGISVNSSLAGIHKPTLIPEEGPQFGQNTSLAPEEVAFLNHHIPLDFRKKWRPLFNSKFNGESFSKLSAAIMNKGPCLIIIFEEGGHKFGGFASDSLVLSPKFYGNGTCFLFSLTPRMFAYESTRFNTNFVYFNLKQKTLPNGFGMGGQLEYFGLWLDSDYGKGRCAPTCSSFQSPQLSSQEHFHYRHLEVWGVGDEPLTDEDEGGRPGALDLDPEAQAVMEMMGKTFVSKTVKAEDEQREKEEKDKKLRENLS